MRSIIKQHVRFIQIFFILLLSFLMLVSMAVVFIYYSLGSSLMHKRNLDQIEVSLDPKEFLYEEVAFESKKDNVNLEGVYFPSKVQSNKTLIIVHGLNQNRMLGGRTETIAKYFVPEGYNVLAFDLRGEGKSGGNLITFGCCEKYDVMGAIDYLKKRGREGEKIALLGFSMGAATVIGAAEKDTRVDAVIADSSFRDLRLFAVSDLINPANESDILSENIAGLPYWPVLCYLPFKYKAVSIMAKLYGIKMEDSSPMNAAKNLSGKPVFIIHGKNDRLISSTNSEAIYKSLTGNPNAKLWLTENAGHMESLDVYKTEYLEAIKSFLDNSM